MWQDKVHDQRDVVYEAKGIRQESSRQMNSIGTGMVECGTENEG